MDLGRGTWPPPSTAFNGRKAHRAFPQAASAVAAQSAVDLHLLRTSTYFGLGQVAPNKVTCSVPAEAQPFFDEESGDLRFLEQARTFQPIEKKPHRCKNIRNAVVYLCVRCCCAASLQPGYRKALNRVHADISITFLKEPRPLKNAQFRSSARAILQDSKIGFAAGEPVRARDMEVPSQRDNIALSLHFVQPNEYIEYFED